jgi:molybdopterin-guanine dinucleotide biosynthesis protein A
MITIAIQAGGQSSRMGRDKGLIKLGTLTLIEHVIGRLAGLGDEVIITTNRPEDYAHLGFSLHTDPQPAAGAAHGLQTALKAAGGDTVLLAACDMPFIEPGLASAMLEQLTDGTDVVVPFRTGRYEPLLAVYRRSTCLQALTQALTEGRKRMISFYSQVNVFKFEDEQLKQLDPQGLSFFNVNTPEDLAMAEQLLGNKPRDTSQLKPG